jgi:YidC/Oxa1 family membrane protein insertase
MEKRTILAIVLVGFIILIMQSEFYKRQLVAPPSSFPPDSTITTESVERPDYAEKEQGLPIVDQQETGVRHDEEIELRNQQPEVPAQEIQVASSLFEATLTNRGGGLISWKLMKYFGADSHYVNLIPYASMGIPGIDLVMEQDTVRFDEHTYSTSYLTGQRSQNIYLDEQNDTFGITYRLELANGQSIEKKYVFYANRYDFELIISLKGFSNLTTDRSYHLLWNASLLPTEDPYSNDLGYTKIYANLGGDLQDFNINEDQRELEVKQVSGTVNWSALRTKYFCSAMVPLDNKGRGIRYQGTGVQLAPGKNFKHYNYSVSMPFVGQEELQSNQFTLYLGPLEYNKLKSLDLDLESLIMSSSGYDRLFRPFSILILIALKFLQQFIPNYGWAIVIFSILIKIILYPLTHKSYVSMKKMQLVQPLVTEIREKYKKDPQRLNKEMMKIYKDYGVNPMGGCLPMLLQMPLLIGLFIVFRSTIELRGAGFMFWINDLSKPDIIFELPFSIPLYGSFVTVLPIIMALSMFLQQKSTISDPRQKMMIYFMPVFFLFLFNTFPSGLNLYYTLFNFLTILQQKFVKGADIQLKPVENKKGKGNRAGR